MIMISLDIFFKFIFVLSIVFVVNQTINVIKNIFSDEPKKIIYGLWEKISNYFFISYLITYFITKIL
jgi:hypothetical protein